MVQVFFGQFETYVDVTGTGEMDLVFKIPEESKFELTTVPDERNVQQSYKDK